jgi:hypothetical protein
MHPSPETYQGEISTTPPLGGGVIEESQIMVYYQ